MTEGVQAQRGIEWLETVLKLANLSASVTAVIPDGVVVEADSCWLTIESSQLTPEQVQILIGKDGEVLDAIQYLASTLLNLGQPQGEQIAYTVELDGYRVRRQVELQTIADQAAAAVRETGQEVEIKSLSSAERRQVHNLLKDCEDLETFSRGSEPDRRLVVKLRSREYP